MRVCARPGCPTIVDAKAYRGLCPTHRAERDRERGTREQRGYGKEHTSESRRLKAAVARGETILCWRCHQPILTPDDLHLGHDDHDRTITRGAEHSDCNLTAAGKAAHR